MPKRLKKHSQIEPKEASPKQNTQQKVKIQENTFSNSLLRPAKMKFSQRLKLFQQGNSSLPIKHKQNLPTQQEQAHHSPETTDVMEIFLNKYTDDDQESYDQKQSIAKTKVAKQKKKDIKTNNKFFSDVEFQEKQQDEAQQLVYQQYELKVDKKQKRASVATLQKFEERANIFKKKLQYKDLNKDTKYKKSLQEKLKSLDQIQDVKIVLEIPKIFGGKNSHLEAAFFLKNNQEEGTQQLVSKVQQSETEEQNSLIQDRKLYYEELGKKVKLKKAETLTENILKECFKKSKLDNQDYMLDFDNNKNYQQTSHFSRPKFCQNQSIDLSDQIKSCKKEETKTQSDKQNTSEYKTQLKQIPCIHEKEDNQQTDAVEQVGQKENSNLHNIKQVNEQIQIIEKKIHENQKLIRKRSEKINKKNFKYKKYLQEQAEVSDDEFAGPLESKSQNQTDQDDDASIDSLIDDDVDIDSKDRYKVHNKFVADMIADEERKYQQMRQKLEKKYLQEQEDLRKRMEEAARKRKEKEEKQYKDMLTVDIDKDCEKSNSISRSNDTATKLKNEEKIKELEQMLKGETKQIRKIKAEAIDNKLKQLQITLLGANKVVFKKPPRNGFKNVIKKPIKANIRKSK